MPNITINIPQPVLAAGQSFKTRYRALPAGAWSSYVSRTNAAFTLTGLAAGDYQLEVIVVNADASECAATYKTFTVVPEFSCISFSAQIVRSGEMHYLQITYTLPGGFVNPACGWEIKYVQDNKTYNNIYTALPSSGLIKIPVANIAMAVFIRANQCNGRMKECYAADVSAAVTPCTPLLVGSYSLTKTAGKFYITINFTQSTPATTTLTVWYSQVGTVMGSGDNGTKTIPITPSATSVKFEVFPARPLQSEMAEYIGSVSDRCPQTTAFSVNTFYY